MAIKCISPPKVTGIRNARIINTTAFPSVTKGAVRCLTSKAAKFQRDYPDRTRLKEKT